jgi:acyl-CoA dehydrogenase
LLKWACEDALYNIQCAMKGIMKNLPLSFIGSLCNFIIFPLTKPYQNPDDKLAHRVARLTLKPSETLDRLSEGIFNSSDKDNATGRITHALNLVLSTKAPQHKIRIATRQNKLDKKSRDIYLEARNKNIITEEEYREIIEAEKAIHNAIKVDEFSFEDWKVETP